MDRSQDRFENPNLRAPDGQFPPASQPDGVDDVF